jgi:hypothetical protein
MSNSHPRPGSQLITVIALDSVSGNEYPASLPRRIETARPRWGIPERVRERRKLEDHAAAQNGVRIGTAFAGSNYRARLPRQRLEFHVWHRRDWNAWEARL